MFKLIKMCIVLALIAGVLILAGRIHQKSSEIGVELAAKREVIRKKISGIQKEAEKKAVELKKSYEKVRMDTGKATETRPSIPETKRPEAENPPEVERTEKGAVSTQVPLHPLDEEDRRLTQEILAKTPGGPPKSEDPSGILDTYSEAAGVKAPGDQNEDSPMDVERVEKIRDLYLKAAKTLDFK